MKSGLASAFKTMIVLHVAPPQYNAAVVVRAAEILAQVGEELAFAQAGRDISLLPINSLVMDFEELPREGTPAVFAPGLAAVRALLDQILDGSGVFTGESIRFLNAWHSWMSSVLTAWERDSVMPAVPMWNQSTEGVLEAPVLNENRCGAIARLLCDSLSACDRHWAVPEPIHTTPSLKS